MDNKISKNEVRALTSIRGIAALYVVLYHFKSYNFFSGPGATFFKHGYLSVDLFFILSGFVMSMTYSHLFRGGFKFSNYYTFLSRRIARVYPLYIMVTFIFMAIIALNLGHPETKQSLSFPVILTNILMVQSWGLSESYLGPAWSISTEWAIYLLFPVLTVLTLSSQKNGAILVALACAILLCCLALLPVNISHVIKFRGPLDISEGRNYGPLLRCLLEFTLGQLAYRLSEWSPIKRVFLIQWTSLVIAASILALLAFKNTDIVVVLIIPALIISLANDKSYLSRAISIAPLHWLGVISYSLYLDHILAFFLRNKLMSIFLEFHIPHPNALIFMAELISAIVFAAITYELIEKPGRRIIRNLLESKKRVYLNPRPDLSPP